MLSEGLTSKQLNFKSLAIDPCVFLRKDAIILTWVDDCLIFSKDLAVVSRTVEILKKNFDVELEEDINSGDVSRYLGMVIERNEDKSFEIKQPYLIERILSLLEIDDKVKSKSTPVSKARRVRKWNY